MPYATVNPATGKTEKTFPTHTPDEVETRLAQAEYDYVVLNDWLQALSEYRAAAAGLPNDAQVQYGIARTLRRLGRFDEAIEGFKVAAGLNPNDDTSAYTVVEMVYALHRYEEAARLGQYFGDRFPGEQYTQYFKFQAQFEVDGDRAALIKALAPLNPFGDSPGVVAYRQALREGDLPAAERALSDPTITAVQNESGTIIEPADLHRAYVAYLLGRAPQAQVFADGAIAKYRKATWTPRQLPWTHLGIAQAEAFKGLAAESIRDGKAALAEMEAIDAYDCLEMRARYGKILVMGGRRDEALSVLEEVASKPMFVAPRDVRLDPIWSRLKDDPRFESILGSVKPL